MNKSISYPAEANSAYFNVEDHSFWFKIRNMWIAYFVAKWVKSGKFIDLGGGNGFVSQGLKKSTNLEITMVEPGPDGCQNAKKRGLENVRQGIFLEHKDLWPVSGVGIFDVLEHIEKPEELLKEIHQSLLPSGILVVTVPAYDFLWSLEDSDIGHFRRYTFSKLKTDLNNAGFEFLEGTYYFTLLVPLIFFVRSIPFRLGLSKKQDNSESHHESLLSKMMYGLLKLEFNLYKIIGYIPFGSSVAMVARKKAL